MKTLNKRVFLLLALLAVVLSCGFFTKNVSAATKTGFVTINGKTYYVKEDGSKAKGWMQLGKYKYYFNKKTGVQQKGWMVDRKGPEALLYEQSRRYVDWMAERFKRKQTVF